MDLTLSVPSDMTITVEVRGLEGGGFLAEVSSFPGCIAQGGTIEEVRENITRAIADWWAESSEKTEQEAGRLVAIQGSDELADGPYPTPYGYLPPPGWTDEDE